MATAEAQPRAKSGRVRIRDRSIHLIRPSPKNERLTTTPTTDARSDSPPGCLDHLAIRHTGRRRLLVVTVHLDDGRTLTIDTIDERIGSHLAAEQN